MSWRPEMPRVDSRHPAAYIITPALYARGKYVIRPLDSVAGYKGLAGRLADELRLKWVNRSRGYTASAAQVRKFEDGYERWLAGRAGL